MPFIQINGKGETEDFGFQIDVRRVVERMRDKGYFTLGEAFDDYFHDWYELVDGKPIPLHA